MRKCKGRSIAIFLLPVVVISVLALSGGSSKNIEAAGEQPVQIS